MARPCHSAARCQTGRLDSATGDLVFAGAWLCSPNGNAAGVAVFTVQSWAGGYRIYVAGATGAGRVYDLSQNVKTYETLTAPRGVGRPSLWQSLGLKGNERRPSFSYISSHAKRKNTSRPSNTYHVLRYAPNSIRYRGRGIRYRGRGAQYKGRGIRRQASILSRPFTSSRTFRGLNARAMTVNEKRREGHGPPGARVRRRRLSDCARPPANRCAKRRRRKARPAPSAGWTAPAGRPHCRSRSGCPGCARRRRRSRWCSA
jgi:hypothetical protein